MYIPPKVLSIVPSEDPYEAQNIGRPRGDDRRDRRLHEVGDVIVPSGKLSYAILENSKLV